MPSPLIEITAQYLSEKPGTRRDSWAVHRCKIVEPAPIDERLRVGGEFEFTGEADASTIDYGQDDERGLPGKLINAELQRGCEYRFYGRVAENSYFNRRLNQKIVSTQFQFTTFARAIPHGKEAVIRYLQEAPHVGPSIARKLWDNFGPDAVRILRESPEVAAAAQGVRLTLPQAEAAALHLTEMAALESVTMEMMSLLDGYGLPKSTARLAIKQWGNRAPALISANPYLLMRFRGIGFLKADKIYLSLGLPATKIKRQALCAWHSLASDTDGHTWLPIKTAKDGIKSHVGGVVELEPDKAIALAHRHGIVATSTDCFGGEWATDGRKARAEDRVADLVLQAMDYESPWAAVLEHGDTAAALSPLDDHQREQLFDALRGPISILRGSPGTGKTFTAAALMKAIVAACGSGSVAIAAPTGKAAVRCSEAMAAYDLPLKARTIHSLLKVSKSGGKDGDGDGSGEWGFEYNASNPLPYRFVIVDESSMIDTPLMGSLLAAISKGSAVLFIGDTNQLPPVGHGAPLRDLIKAGIPSGELTDIKRNAGTIVRACGVIRDIGDSVVRSIPTDAVEAVDLEAQPPRNLPLIPASTAEDVTAKILETIRAIREGGKFDPVWDTQIVVAVNDKSCLSRKSLNKILQTELNPSGLRVEGSPFRVNDKVIQLKNQFYRVVDPKSDYRPLDSGEEAFIANGEFGRVVVVEEKRTVVRFPSGDSPRFVVIPRGKQEGDGGSGDGASAGEGSVATGCNLDLGYAATCHKMQGSQSPIVIVALDDYPGASGRYGVAKREWLYTAISRAEKLCYLIGKQSTALKMMRERALPGRKTFLREKIEAGRVWGERVWWVEEVPIQVLCNQ